jgi:hypothetical protein
MARWNLFPATATSDFGAPDRAGLSGSADTPLSLEFLLAPALCVRQRAGHARPLSRRHDPSRSDRSDPSGRAHGQRRRANRGSPPDPAFRQRSQFEHPPTYADTGWSLCLGAERTAIPSSWRAGLDLPIANFSISQTNHPPISRIVVRNPPTLQFLRTAFLSGSTQWQRYRSTTMFRRSGRGSPSAQRRILNRQATAVAP